MTLTGAFPRPLRVLLAEDEPLILMMLEEVVKELGFEVAGTASELESALEQARSADFDAAILDWNLAGVSCLPVAEAVRMRGKALLLVTGYDENSLPESLRAFPLLRKPFDQAMLAQALLRAINCPGQRGKR